MAKYVIVPDKHEKIEKNYVFPFINIVPAVVWSIPIHQKLFPKAGFWIVAFYTVAFIALYLYVSLKPFIAVAPCIAGVGSLPPVMVTVALFTTLAMGVA